MTRSIKLQTVSGHNISRYVFGAWAIGGAFTGPVADEDSLEALTFGFRQGINAFDSAPGYGNGHSEKLLGRFIANKRNQVFVASKGGMRWRKTILGREAYSDCTALALEEDINCSLDYLQSDYIDLYHVHWPDKKTPFDETCQCLQSLRESGKIRYVGVSNFSLSQLQSIQRYVKVDVIQNQYNLLDQSADEMLINYCQRNGIAFWGYGALAYGLLSAKFRSNHVFAENDWRRCGQSPTNSFFTKPFFLNNVKKANELALLAKSIGCSAAQIAIAWSLRHDNTYALVGAKTQVQVEHNLPALNLLLTNELMLKIDGIFHSP